MQKNFKKECKKLDMKLNSNNYLHLESTFNKNQSSFTIFYAFSAKKVQRKL